MALPEGATARERAEHCMATGIDPRADGWAILALADEVAALRAVLEEGVRPDTPVMTVNVAGTQAPGEIAEAVAGSAAKTRRRTT